MVSDITSAAAALTAVTSRASASPRCAHMWMSELDVTDGRASLAEPGSLRRLEGGGVPGRRETALWEAAQLVHSLT